MARALTGFVIQGRPRRLRPDPPRQRQQDRPRRHRQPRRRRRVREPPAPATNIIDILFARTDSDGELAMPRYLAKKFWEYFAYPNPTKARVDELTGPFIAGGFFIRDLLRSIFLHDDFYSAEAKSQSVKNPCEFAFHAIRATARLDQRQDPARSARQHGHGPLRSADRERLEQRSRLALERPVPRALRVRPDRSPPAATAT